MANPDERHALAYQALKNTCIALCERGDFEFGEKERRQLIDKLVECRSAETDLGSDRSLFPTRAYMRKSKSRTHRHG